MHRFSSLVSLTAFTLAAHTSAQNWLFGVGEIGRVQVAGAANHDFGTAVAGHLMGFDVNDVVMLAGGTPMLVTAPGAMQSAVALPLPANLPAGFDRNDVRDIAVLHHDGERGLDTLVMVTGTGLYRWWSHSSVVSSPLGPIAVWSPNMEALGTAVWGGALRLRAADLDRDGHDELLGLMANGHTLRCLRGPSGPWTIDTVARVRDFVVADLVPGGALELAAVIGPVTTPAFAGGVRVFAPANPTPLAELALPNTSAVVTALADASGIGLAVASSYGGVPEVHTVAMSGGVLAVVDSAALPDEPTAITAGVWLHAQEDLLLSCRTISAPILVRHVGAFTLGGVQLTPLVLSAIADNRATPLLVDLHGDPDSTDPEMRTQNRLVYPHSATGDVLVQRIVTYDDRFVTLAYGNGNIGLTPPPHVIAQPYDPTSWPTHVEAIMWKVSGTPLHYESMVATTQTAQVDYGAGTAGVLLTIADPATNAAYVMMTRYVRLDAVGNVLKRWPMRMSAVSFSAAITQELFAAGGGEQPANVPTGDVNACEPPIYCGITGDVVQPPAAPDSGSNGPPTPGK